MKSRIGTGLAVAVAMIGASVAQAAYLDSLNINLTGNTYGSGESVGIPINASQNGSFGFNNNWSQLRIVSENAASVDTYVGGNSYWRIYTPPSTISALSPDETIQTSVGDNVALATSGTGSGFHIQGSQTTGGALRWGEQSSSPYGSHASDRGLLNGATLNNTEAGSVTWTLVNVPFASYEVWGFMGVSTQMQTPDDWSWVQLGSSTLSSFTSTWTDVGGANNYAAFAAFRILELEAQGGGAVPEPGTWLLLGGSLLGLCVGGFKRIRSKLSA